MIVILILLFVLEAVAVSWFVLRTLEKKLICMEREKNKYNAYFLFCLRWLQLKQKGVNLAKFFRTNGYYKIAVYGWGTSGRALVSELAGSGVEVLYLIDQNAEQMFADIPIHAPNEPVSGVDVLVITPVDFYADICKTMRGHTECPIVSLDDVVYSL